MLYEVITVKDPGENWLVQLLNGSDKVVNQKYVPKSGKFSFQYIKPGKYSLKLVVDSNRNGKWDSGSYKNKIQPEMILYYPRITSYNVCYTKLLRFHNECIRTG